MALFFNLETLEAQSGNDAVNFLGMLWYHYSKRLPTRYSKVKPSRVSLAGQSFLLFPEPLFIDNTDILYKVQYIKLAARRDWNLYKQYKYKSLETSFFPDLNYDAIRSNPLLKITPTEITFKYEES
jgi:hypothetical protein